MKAKNYLMMAASLVLALVVQANFAIAQTLKLEEYQKSCVLFDIRVDKLIEEAVAAGMSKEQFDELGGPFGDIKPSEIVRVFGSYCFPKNLRTTKRAADSPPEKYYPNELFVRIKFADADVLGRLLALVKEISVIVKLEDGKEYMTPKQGLANEFIFFRRVDKTMFEFGTRAYLVQPKRNFFTARLKQAFAAAPKEPIRIVVDLETRRELIQQKVEQYKSNPNLGFVGGAYLDLLDNVKSLTVTSSISSENLLSVIVEANNDSDAEELAEGIASLLAWNKIEFGKSYTQMDALAEPEMKGPLKKIKTIVDSLAVSQSGSTVKVLVEKPDDFVVEVFFKIQKSLTEQVGRFWEKPFW